MSNQFAPITSALAQEAASAVQRMGSQRRAARYLGIARSTLQQRLLAAEKFNNGAVSRPPAQPPPSEDVKPRIRVRSGRTKVMVIGDAHDSPQIPKDRFRWMGKLAGDERPDYVISIGDLLTLDSLNSHIPNETQAGRLKGSFELDIASGAEALGEFDAALPGGYKPKKHVTLGNHERRVWLFEESHPEVGTLMRGELTDLLTRHQWDWSEYGEFFFLNGVGFVHAALNRLGKAYGGKNAEHTICNDAVFDMMIGHSHTDRKWKAPKIGPGQHVSVINCGCALPQGHVEDYAKHNTTGWSWGVNLIDICGSHITDHAFISMASLEDRYG